MNPINFEEGEVFERNLGGKAKNLNILKNYFNVPEYILIPGNKISKYLNEIGITPKIIKEAFNGTEKERRNLRRKIMGKPFKPTLNKLNKLNNKIIVRSAALGEDSSKYSFAGIYESKKTTKAREDLEKSISFVIKTAFSERVFHYSKQIGLSTFPKLSIIIQNYISNPLYSGVSFATTRYNEKEGILINVAKGSTENAVLGKNICEIFIEGNKFPKSPIPKKIIMGVYKSSKKIEKLFGKPQDIEWCYTNNSLYVLQSRPITKNIDEEIIIWDNSNISESYSGIVLPLTCSFAQFVYSRVYKDVAKNSNIDRKKIKKHSNVLNNLLGFHYGRFYYNMNNWYKMLTLFPGYDRNKENLEMMISAKSKSELDLKHKKSVTTKDKIKYYSHIIRRLIFFNKELNIFKKNTKSYLERAKQKRLESLNLSQLWDEFKNYQKNLLNYWSITVDNDFLAMTWFGLYKKIATNKGLSDSEIIQQISNLKSVISAEQVSKLKMLSVIAFQNEKRVGLAKKKKWEECYLDMLLDEKIKNKINSYTNIYGGRFANELKLEAQDLDSDPEYLAELLYSYYKMRKFVAPTTKLKSNNHNSFLLKFLSKKAKHYLKNREELRLLRSQAFSYTRKLFIVIGKLFCDTKRIDKSEDIFYLTLNEIRQSIYGGRTNLKTIIKKRKEDYKKYSSVELDSVLITRGNETPTFRNNKKVVVTKTLQGKGCSRGTISGRITIMNKFKLPEKPLDIVVVKHTDPGWTPLFGLCKGLIVENGGILSHAAIISRELNLPCIIGVKDATRILKEGSEVIMDASLGKIEVTK